MLYTDTTVFYCLAAKSLYSFFWKHNLLFLHCNLLFFLTNRASNLTVPYVFLSLSLSLSLALLLACFDMCDCSVSMNIISPCNSSQGLAKMSIIMSEQPQTAAWSEAAQRCHTQIITGTRRWQKHPWWPWTWKNLTIMRCNKSSMFAGTVKCPNLHSSWLINYATRKSMEELQGLKVAWRYSKTDLVLEIQPWAS